MLNESHAEQMALVTEAITKLSVLFSTVDVPDVVEKAALLVRLTVEHLSPDKTGELSIRQLPIKCPDCGQDEWVCARAAIHEIGDLLMQVTNLQEELCASKEAYYRVNGQLREIRLVLQEQDA